MIELPPQWAPALIAQPETGMGYQVCNVELHDGSVFHRVVIAGGFITNCNGSTTITFAASQIESITVTHER